MLISHVSEGSNEDKGGVSSEDHAEEYQTANELFELMARNNNFRPTDNESLTTRDLVLIYKNIDLGTKLMSNAKEFKKKSPNQYVETVVYEDHDSESDLDEVYSAEDLHNVIMINKERIDLLNNPSSIDNTLCHKLGELKMQATSTKVECDQNFRFFKDPYIQDQLNNLNSNSSEDTTDMLLPATLLDYICCKRLEDNYTFYMENIIKYVKNTIDQLKRISNGDYLTDKAKEKWKEVQNEIESKEYRNDDKNNSKVLATSTSIPLHVEKKENGNASFWDEIVHSDVDVRSLSKILEKKIVVEVPKSICGSYKFFSKCYNDNLIIRCKKDKKRVKSDDKGEERVDVVVKLARSESGHVISNIESIMFLQTKPVRNDLFSEVLSLPESSSSEKVSPVLEEVIKETKNTIIEVNEEESREITTEIKETDPPKVIEDYKDATESEFEQFDAFSNKPVPDENLEHIEDTQLPENIQDTQQPENIQDIQKPEHSEETQNTEHHGDADKPAFKDFFTDLYPEDDSSNNGWYINDENRYEYSFPVVPEQLYPGASDSLPPQQYTCDPDYQSGDSWEAPLKRSRKETSYKNITPDELRMTIQRLNMQDSLPEDPAEDSTSPCKKRSPIRNRIKSPYENKSLAIEERKRNKLLEIRLIREKQKIALSEKSNISSKMKFGKGINVPQSSSSVTNLSITNKSFYNSIYGQNSQVEPKRYTRRKLKKGIVEDPMESTTDSRGLSTARSQRGINNTFYLDDTMTEMMYIKMNKKVEDVKETYSETNTSLGSNASSHVMSPQQIDPMPETQEKDRTVEPSVSIPFNNTNVHEDVTISNTSRNTPLSIDRENPLKRGVEGVQAKKKISAIDLRNSIDLRKSISKIYDLINKSAKTDSEDKEYETTDVEPEPMHAIPEYKSNSQCSDSGTSLKHQTVSSNISYFSFTKCDETAKEINDPKTKKISKPESPVVTKVIISTKSQTAKAEKDKNTKKERYQKNSPSGQQPDNPIKAISHLLQEIDNVQKQRIKTSEKNKKSSEFSEPKSVSFLSTSRKPRTMVDPKEIEPRPEKETRLSRNVTPKDRKLKQIHTMIDYGKMPPVYQDDKSTPRPVKKQVSDYVDEYKESRGEAVRGPSKFLSARLNSLAQPRKYYVQAQFEHYQATHGRNRLSDRLQRLVAPISPARASTTSKNKQKNDARGLGAFPPPDKDERLKSITNINPNTINLNNDFSSKRIGNNPITKKRAGAADSKNLLKRPTAPFDMLLEQLLEEKSSPSMSECDTHLEESAKIAKKLHIMIDSVVKPTPTILKECNENTSKVSLSNPAETIHNNSNNSLSDTEEMDMEPVLCNWDASNGDNNEESTKATLVQSVNETNTIMTDGSVARSLHSLTETSNIQRCMTAGTFHNRVMSLKNLTLTPKQSTQHVMLLQSGDASSFVVKSTLSQELKMETSKRSSYSELKVISELQNSKFDWTFTQIPMQITTVGYSFPQYKVDPNVTIRVSANRKETRGTLKSRVSPRLRAECSCIGTHKSCQCFKGGSAVQSHGKCLAEKLSAPLKGLKVNFKESIQTSSTKTHLNEVKEDNSKERFSNNDVIPSTLVFRNSKIDRPIPCAKAKGSKGRNIISDIILEASLENIVDDDAKDVIRVPLEIDKQDKQCPSQDVTERDHVPNKHVKSELSCVEEKSENTVDYSTSLDILVGLLNEIKNITTCQTQMTSPKADQDSRYAKDAKEFESIVEKSMSLDHTLHTTYPTYKSEIVSINSLDRLRQLESNTSMYSLLLSSDGDREYPESEVNVVDFDFYSDHNIMTVWPKATVVDKEIGVDIPKREFVSTCTEVPSVFFPVSINHATSTISNAGDGVISKPSAESIRPIAEPAAKLSVAKVTRDEKIVELNKTIENSSVIVLKQAEENLKENSSIMVNQTETYLKENSKIILKKNGTNLKENSSVTVKSNGTSLKKNSSIMAKQNRTNLKEKSSIMVKQTGTNLKEVEDSNASVMATISQTVENQKPQKDIKSESIVDYSKENPMFGQLDKCANLVSQISLVKDDDSDPVMKMKRDVLVTMYSILVFTVFAALSFPQVIYR